MMGALGYLFLTRLKNQAKQFIRKPSKIIFALLLVAALGVTILPSAGEEIIYENYRSIEEFYAIITVLYCAVFVTVAKNGFSNGGSIFSMADVNLIFVSPLKSSSALFFGMLQQLGKSLYLGVFLLFQYTLAREYYGIEYSTLIFVAIGYGVTALFAQMLATLIYTAVGSSDKKTNIGKIIFYGTVALFAILAALKGDLLNGFTVEKAVSAVRSDIMYLFPVSGFVTLGVEGAISGEVTKLLIGLGAGAVFSLAYYFILSRVKGDYYEDVLLSAETSFSAITAAKEGKTPEVTPKKIRIGKSGFSKGFGASVIKEKHKIENRRSKVFILDRISLVITVMIAVYSFIMPDIITVFTISVYTLTITVATGRWAKELTNPYVYLIPEKPFKKLINLIWEQIPRITVESVICFIPIHFILEEEIGLTVSMIVARIGFGFVFISANLIMQRLFSTAERNVISVMVYMLITVVLSLPAIIFAVITVFSPYFIVEIPLLATVPVNILVSAVTLFFVRNVLQYSEYSYK